MPEWKLLNKFDVFTHIAATPADILLSQKFYAIINRKRNKGRDFFDVVFLLGKDVRPFLFNRQDVKKVIFFEKYLIQVKL